MRGIRTPLGTTSIPAVEKGWVLAVAIPDQVPDLAAGVLEIHDQVPGGLGHPGGGRVRGDAEDPDPAGGVLDHGQHVQVGAGQRHGFEEGPRQ